MPDACQRVFQQKRDTVFAGSHLLERYDAYVGRCASAASFWEIKEASQTVVLDGVVEVSGLDTPSEPQEEMVDAPEESPNRPEQDDEPVFQGLGTNPTPEYNLAESGLVRSGSSGPSTSASSTSTRFVSGLAIGCCATAVVAFAAVFYDKKTRRKPQRHRYNHQHHYRSNQISACTS